MSDEQDLREALVSEDAERRRQAVAALADAVPPDAADLIYGALGDRDWRVRKQAVEVAVALSERVDIVSKLIDALCDGDNVGRRNAGLEVFGRLGPGVSRPLVDSLANVPSAARKFVIDALGDAGDRRALDVLVDAAEHDPDPNVAAAALDSLARVGGPEAEAALRRRLKSSDPFQRMAALDGLARLGATVPWEEIEPLLGDRLVRRVALALLGRTGRTEAIDPLADALADASPHVVSIAVVALVQLQGQSDALATAVSERMRRLPEPARRALRSLLVGGDLRSRQAAAHLLLLARDDEALEGVVTLAAEDALSPAALAVLQVWGTAAVPALLEVHRTARGPARPTALEIAADLGAEPFARGATPPPAQLQASIRRAVRAATRDPDPFVVLAAARSMTWWAEAEDAPLLVRLASHGREDVARACGEALEALSESSPDAVRAALDGIVFDGIAGAALAGVAARIGGPQTFERLQTALAADEPEARKAAVDALADVGDRRSAEHIGYALTDENVDVQTAAATALGRMRDESGRSMGADALLIALESDAPAVQAAAARALGEAGDARAVEPLRGLVRSTAPGVAVAAMQALRRLHDPTLGTLLVEALAHEDGEVAKQALKAIHETGGEQAASRLALGLSHAAWDVRALAAHLLGELGGLEAIEALQARRDRETDATVKRAIEEALGGEGSR